MAEFDATAVLRQGLLEGVSIVLAHAGVASPATGPPGGPVAAAVRATCAALAGAVHECPLICSGRPEADDAVVDDALVAVLAGAGGAQVLVVDGGGLFARVCERADPSGGEAVGRGGARADALIATLEASWRVTRAVANAAFIPGDAGGRIVYLAPPPARGGDTHADAARAGLENLARTLSIEWARHGITPVAIAPGPQSSADEVAAIVAYLASPAGSYFSGCLLDLRGPSGEAGVG